MIRLTSLESYRNFGDALSPVLVRAMTEGPVESTSIRKGELVAVGSLLSTGRELYRAKTGPCKLATANVLRMKLSNALSPVLKVWGTGFLYEDVPARYTKIRTLDVRAVRGTYTLDVLEKTGFCAKGQSIAFGDPGVFYASLLKELPAKKYELGVVPHEVDRYAGEFVVEKLRQAGIAVKYIDVADEPLKVLEEIAACQHVISSSLHGLIVSDSLGIPNRQMMLSYFGYTKERYLFKFRDYYSAYGLELPAPLTPADVFGNASEIVRLVASRPYVSMEQVRSCRQNLLNAFPYSVPHPERWLV